MAALKSADFLVEIGTEELPPKALRNLMLSFSDNLERLLQESRLDHGSIQPLASPRRIAAIVSGLAMAQEDREVDAKGPPASIGFDDKGEATPAALAFARKCGVDVNALERTKTDKGEWLSYRSVEAGATAAALLPHIVEQALQNLPIPRRMRWGASGIEFVRPVHWVVMLHGKAIVPGTVLGHAAGDITFGHRFLSSGGIKISAPAKYLGLLEKKGFVLADFDVREHVIREQVSAAAKAAGGSVAATAGLFEEVAALTEWPVAMTGHFDENFLQLPQEAIIASLTGHQRYFPIVDDSGSLMPAFVVVANLASKAPDKVRDGNERVIRPRLADAAFFWQLDRQTPLADRASALERIVYQKGLGSLLDKSARAADLCAALAKELGIAADDAVRAAAIAKCDLLTGMVGEFPELQGVMGGYYARSDGETEAVASAIEEQYLPKFSGDAVPTSAAGQILALADKLDTLAGVFSIGKKPSGSKDPFGLRRAALGVVRILLECELELDLKSAVQHAVSLQPADQPVKDDVSRELFEFIVDRLRSFYVDRPDVSIEIFDAVLHAENFGSLLLPDFERRIQAVQTFTQLAESASLASANKRISNILRQSRDQGAQRVGDVEESLLQEGAERDLYDALMSALAEVAPLQDVREYAAVLERLAVLKEPVDRFFDEVLVMADDAALKQNRLALLSRLREPFHLVADISRLSVAKADA
jgi:glycyl-tRNA synthetase beta chain